MIRVRTKKLTKIKIAEKIIITKMEPLRGDAASKIVILVVTMFTVGVCIMCVFIRVYIHHCTHLRVRGRVLTVFYYYLRTFYISGQREVVRSR